MTAPKVSREEAARVLDSVHLQYLASKAKMPVLAYLRAVVSALEPEPSAVEELLRAAETHLKFLDGAGYPHWGGGLETAISAVRRERGEEGKP